MSLALSTATPAYAGYPSWVTDRETALGLTRVDNSDGTFHYALPSGLSNADQVGDVFTWRYVRQADFPDDPERGQMLASADDEQDTGDDPSAGLDGVVNWRSVDEYGREWRVVDFDLVAATYAIADYWAAVDSSWGLEQDPGGTPPDQTLDALDSTVADHHATSWTTWTCGGSKTVMQLWGSDSRTTFNSAGTSIPDRQKALVEVRGPTGTCSGVKIAEGVVMTAAHCVTDRLSGQALASTFFRVCSSSSGTCQSASGRPVPSPSWPGEDNVNVRHMRHDWAILRYTGTLSDPVMALSTDNRSQISRRTPRRVGFEGFRVPVSTCQSVTAPTALEHPATEVRGTRSGLVRLRADVSAGSSGGPYFYEHGGVGRILALQSGFRTSTASGFVGGPRVTEFRHAAIIAIANP